VKCFEDVQSIMIQFQNAQNELNAEAASNLFSEGGIANIPLGTNTVIGRSLIFKNFKNYYQTLFFSKRNCNWSFYYK